MTTTADDLVTAVLAAEADALAQHRAGTCHLSEWSCSYCERDADVVREIGWIAREARALIEERVSPDSERWATYTARKRAALDYIAAQESAR